MIRKLAGGNQHTAKSNSNIKIDPSDLFVVAGYDTGSTILAELDGEPVELVGTLDSPISVDEFRQVNIDPVTLILSGAIGKVINGEAVYYTIDNDYYGDDDYSGLPPHQLGNFFENQQLRTDKRDKIGMPVAKPTENKLAFTGGKLGDLDSLDDLDNE
jgi:hypothetical protein